MFLCSALTTLFAVISLLVSVQAASLAARIGRLSLPARDILKRTSPAAPHFVVYSDKYVSTEPTMADINGFNVFALSFLLTSGAADKAMEWQELTSDERTTILAEYNATGISLIVSLFGSTETPTSSGFDATNTANTMAAWVLQYGLLGVDVDYEDFFAFDSGTGSAELWLGIFTAQLRMHLPQGQYILSHAPVAPWFSPGTPGGGYLSIDKNVGSMIDWYNIQFYNQGTTEYTTCDGLLYNSSSVFPQSSLFEIFASGIPLDKLVIGKPATTSDAANGYMDTTLLASCVARAQAAGWTAGVMVWEYPDAASEWITAIRGNTWPVFASPNITTTPTTDDATPASTSQPGANICAGVSAWHTKIGYNGGAKVTYNGYLWIASYWNTATVPGGPSGAWVNGGACA